MTNFEKINLLCKFFRENPDYAKELLVVYGQQTNIFRMDSLENQIPVLQKIWWICQSSSDNTIYFGICNNNTIVQYREGSAELNFMCEGFEYVPFWIKDYELCEINQEYLKNYTNWCSQNNIILDWENTKKDLYRSENLIENPFYFPMKEGYINLTRKIYLDVEITNFEEIKIIEDIKLPLIHNLPPCIEPEFVYSDTGDIHPKFFEFYKTYPYFANIYLSKNEKFSSKFFRKMRKNFKQLYQKIENSSSFIRIPQRTLHGF